jgi:hypothetical protein
MGKGGVRAGLFALGRVGESPRGGGWGKVLGLGISADDDVVEGFWIGRPNESSLESVAPRLNGGVSRSARVHLAAASVAGATEKRRPIWTVALLSVLCMRWCRSVNGSLGLLRKSQASLTFVTEPRRVKRRRASLETEQPSCVAFGS